MRFGVVVNHRSESGILDALIREMRQRDHTIYRIRSDGHVGAYKRSKPPIDWYVLFGDRRLQILLAVEAARLGYPIAHIHGGESMDSGHIDESTRFAVTQYAHIHFTPTQEASRRLEQMGEQKFRIKHVGSPAIDAIKHTQVKEVAEAKPYGIILQYPEWLRQERYEKQVSVVKVACEKTGMRFITNPQMEHDVFINHLHQASILVGNSSCMYTEAAYLKIPCVQVGERNKNRVQVDNVVNAPCSISGITRAITAALKLKPSGKAPYGKGGACGKIVRCLENTAVNHRLMCKVRTY